MTRKQDPHGRAAAGVQRSSGRPRTDAATVTHGYAAQTLARLSFADRRRILARVDELAELAVLVRQRGALAEAVKH